VPRLVTIAEYEQIPDPPEGHLELRHGEVLLVTWPVRQHKDLQRRIRKLFDPVAEPLGYIVDTEYPYRPLPEYEVWEQTWPAFAATVIARPASGWRARPSWLSR